MISKSGTKWAVLAIVSSVAALSLGDALVKASSMSLALWQMFLLRSAIVVPVLWALAHRSGGIRVIAPGWIVVRSALLVAMWLSYYAALPLMPLSLAAAGYYAGPLMIVALAALVTRRWPGGRACVAIGLGFAGVILVIRPEATAFSASAFLPLIAAFLYACAMMVTWTKCQKDSPIVLALALNIAFVVTGAGLGLFASGEGGLLLGPWQPVNISVLAVLAALAVLLIVGSVGAAFAYQNGRPATIAAFDYSYLVFSLIWGAIFFGEWPGILALVGMSAIVGGGLLTLRPQKGDQS